MKTRLLIIIIVGIMIAIAGILVFTTIVFDDFAIYLCDSWFFNTCVKIWEDPSCHEPGSGCIMSEKTYSERLERILEICSGKFGISLEKRTLWINETHIINSESCKLKKRNNSVVTLDRTVYPVLQSMLSYCSWNDTKPLINKIWQNDTHTFSIPECEWQTQCTTGGHPVLIKGIIDCNTIK